MILSLFSIACKKTLSDPGQCLQNKNQRLSLCQTGKNTPLLKTNIFPQGHFFAGINIRGIGFSFLNRESGSSFSFIFREVPNEEEIEGEEGGFLS